jgi:hypothetical protein
MAVEDLPHAITNKLMKSDHAGTAIQQNLDSLLGGLRRLGIDLGSVGGGEPGGLFDGDFPIEEDPPLPEPGTLRLTCIDDGTGKAQLVVIDSSGVQTALVTET